MRVGLGYDAHPFVKGRPLILCGVHVPYEMGLDGHSDADVALHAVCDALLGAASLGDIGELFPSDEPQYAGISSTALLERTLNHIRGAGYEPVQVDVIIVASEPKLSPYKGAMREHLASLLGLPITSVSVKAKTTNGLGFVGKGEGIEAYAVALLRRYDDSFNENST
ncbi:MAG: 2-C-methyl-D-erythritol 2,4-cyclodiphosphate synthase [Armatimonadetes bacterium]|nr:2-C-methyl-D-erythritol 2,4-cyclodiphosphate synthase [Armatimonadota bacterium]MCX7778203.1 2-C-methyl-D-erythritol 2,4-cyclodiphosphate synthase [Armatimonadota bacterium]